jgi:hypothetical protein
MGCAVLQRTREDWSLENWVALAERYRLLEAEGGTAAELVYGLLHSQETFVSLPPIKPHSPML